MATTSVDLEVLSWGLGEVFQPIPPAERKNYSYFRGAHLGAIAASLCIGDSLAPMGSNGEAHITRLYNYALQTAHNLATEADSLQFDEAADEFLASLYGAPLPKVMPSIVFGIQPNSGISTRPSDGFGLIASGVNLDTIDPYSLRTLQLLLSI